MVSPPSVSRPAERARLWSGRESVERGDRLCRSRGGLHSCGLREGANWTRLKRGGGGAGSAVGGKKKKSPRRQAVESVKFSGPRSLTRGWSVRGPGRAARRAGEIQAAVGRVENPEGYPRCPRTRHYPPPPPPQGV